MFQTKKKKIQKYLHEKAPNQFTPFDELLDDSLFVELEELPSSVESLLLWEESPVPQANDEKPMVNINAVVNIVLINFFIIIIKPLYLLTF